MVSATAILGDLLIIAIVGVPFSDAEIYQAYKASVWLSVAILGLMVLVVVAVAVGWRTGNRAVLRAGGMPDTVLEVARRVVQGKSEEGWERDGAALMQRYGENPGMRHGWS